ncbi:MAG TPA: transglycosylase SLT domain-containing protein [Pyrinomonadaceae bacterium]|nr:transglycosylase SLT domain-containing protein [Pyrinomonadaceae bacterium]
MSRKHFNVLAVVVGLVVISGGSIHLQAQKRHARSQATKPAAEKFSNVQARAGDTLTTLAERAGFNPLQLARLNGLSVNSKLKAGQLVIVPASGVAQSTAAPAENRTEKGKLITFVDGGTIHVDDAWWHGEEVWYKRDALTEAASRKVKSIEPVFVAQVDTKAKTGTPPSTLPVEKPKAVTASTWIYLVGGAKFKVDEVKETADGAWYQRANLLSFLDRNRIDRIERNLPDAASSADWKERGWTSGSPSIDQLIRTYGNRYGVDPYLVFLVIEQESHFHPRALSPKGARGLMQLMPGTARRFGVSRPFEPTENIRGGTQYLRDLLRMFNGQVDLALASYNAGEGRVISYGNKVPPFQETRNYVKKIRQRYGRGTNLPGEQE